MRKAGGYAVIISPEEGVATLDDRNARPEALRVGATELDTYSCGHCGSIRHVRPRERPEDTGGLCKQCMRLICPHCLETGRCDPLEKKLERAEQRERTLKSYGL